MGASGSGGQRSGAGRKAQPASVVALRGGRQRRIVRPEVAERAMVPMPEGLVEDVAATWRKLAPHATKAGTLAPTTVEAFIRLCQAVVKHGQMDVQVARDGLTYLKVTVDGTGQEHTELKAHPLIARAHALDTSIRSWFKDFGINPFGKPLAEAAVKPVDPFAAFEQAG